MSPGPVVERVRLLSGAAFVAVILLSLPAIAVAAEPTPGVGGDPRSAGEGPGLVGDPLFAIGAVLLVGVVSLVLSLVYVRLTDRSRRRPRGE